MRAAAAAIAAAAAEQAGINDKNLAGLNNATGSQESAEAMETRAMLRALTISHLTELQERGTQLTPEQESELQKAFVARIAFLTGKGENRTYEEEMQLLQAIFARIEELVSSYVIITSSERIFSNVCFFKTKSIFSKRIF